MFISLAFVVFAFVLLIKYCFSQRINASLFLTRMLPVVEKVQAKQREL